MTPHEGEAARLLRTERLSSDRVAAAQEIASSGSTVLLKGYRSIIAERGKTPLIVPRGNRALAIPGSGDVLSGICGAFLAAGLPRRPHRRRYRLFRRRARPESEAANQNAQRHAQVC